MAALARILLLALPAAATVLTAEPADGVLAPATNRHWTFSLQVENDIVANRDSDYTNGVRLSWVSPDLLSYEQAGTIPGFIYRVSDLLPFINAPAMQRNVVLSIGQNMYTPEEITLPVPDPTDRPYAGWLYAGVAFHNRTERPLPILDRTVPWLDVMELNVGVIGPASQADDIQRAVHKVIKSPMPQGWDYQIKNEVVVNLVWERKIRFWRSGLGVTPSADKNARLADAYGWAADAFAHYGGSLGTLYTYGNAGLTLRGGWNLPSDFGASTIRLAGDTNSPAVYDDPRLRVHARWGINGFVAADNRLVLRDAALDGNLFRDSVSVDKYPFVTDFSAGISLLKGSWKLSYAQVARSKEFRGQRQDWHVFGSITVSCTY